MTRERMSDTIKRMERELGDALDEIEYLKSCEALHAVTRQRDILAEFARECSRWGVDPCPCNRQADRAISEAEREGMPKGGERG